MSAESSSVRNKSPQVFPNGEPHQDPFFEIDYHGAHKLFGLFLASLQRLSKISLSATRSERQWAWEVGRRPIASDPACRQWVGKPSFILLLCTGFAVVKKGKDKTTGEPVAIKVSMSMGGFHEAIVDTLYSTVFRSLTSQGTQQGTTV